MNNVTRCHSCALSCTVSAHGKYLPNVCCHDIILIFAQFQHEKVYRLYDIIAFVLTHATKAPLVITNIWHEALYRFDLHIN